MDWLLGRNVIIGLAVLGGVFSGVAWLLGMRRGAAESRVRWLNVAGYIFMAASMTLFIIAGFYKSGS